MEASLDYSMSGADFPAIQKGFAVGQSIEARFGGKAKWFAGKITAVGANEVSVWASSCVLRS